jgi:DNA-binding beta-propeller fold protein YncE
MRAVAARLLIPFFLLLVLPFSVSWGQPLVKPNLAWPAAPEQPRVSFVRSFSNPEQLGIDKGGLLRFFRELLFGKEPREMARPYGIAVSPGGDRICVADPGARAVHVFDLRSGAYVAIRSSGGESLRSPVGVALDQRGNLYVADSERSEILVFDPGLRPVFNFGREQRLERPTGIAAAGQRLYVADTAAHQVVVFEVSGASARELYRFGGRGTGPGRFNYPVDIALRGSDRVYVNDSMNFRIQVFDGQGGYLDSMGSPGGQTGQLQRSKGIALDSDGNLYVVDALADTVQIFDQRARFLLNFGGPGSGDGAFWLPSGMAIDDADRIYVVDSYNRRVQIFQYLKEGTTHAAR